MPCWMRVLKRARPIVMTTIAMGAGMLPIALGMGTDPSFRAPMATVVIGGSGDLDLPQFTGYSGGIYLRGRWHAVVWTEVPAW